MSARITDNIHLKGHTYLISGHDGKAQRGQDFDQKGRTGSNNEISSFLLLSCPGKPSNTITVTNKKKNKNCKLRNKDILE